MKDNPITEERARELLDKWLLMTREQQAHWMIRGLADKRVYSDLQTALALLLKNHSDHEKSKYKNKGGSFTN